MTTQNELIMKARLLGWFCREHEPGSLTYSRLGLIPQEDAVKLLEELDAFFILLLDESNDDMITLDEKLEGKYHLVDLISIRKRIKFNFIEHKFELDEFGLDRSISETREMYLKMHPETNITLQKVIEICEDIRWIFYTNISFVLHSETLQVYQKIKDAYDTIEEELKGKETEQYA